MFSCFSRGSSFSRSSFSRGSSFSRSSFSRGSSFSRSSFSRGSSFSRSSFSRGSSFSRSSFSRGSSFSRSSFSGGSSFSRSLFSRGSSFSRSLVFGLRSSFSRHPKDNSGAFIEHIIKVAGVDSVDVHNLYTMTLYDTKAKVMIQEKIAERNGSCKNFQSLSP